MPTRRALATLLVASSGLAIPSESSAQISKLIDRAKREVNEAKGTVANARALRCDVQGVCGDVKQSEHFAPDAYESVAVTVFDGTNQFRAPGVLGVVRDAFESKLVTNGFLLAASSDAGAVRDKIARGKDGWTDEDLKQLKDFINGIDAVVVVEIREFSRGTCTIDAKPRPRYGSEATVQLSVRWLNPDAGDIPWVATHSVTLCEERAQAAGLPTTALKTAASQLATSLPTRKAGSR
ncbi:MAG TPA: hypothetical protein VFZ21_03770 [Gemmatimonadaceae bacterium]|jgi:hypothetical protein|nr:hypothetical protein [Gemmatimonadaceae bacterium]